MLLHQNSRYFVRHELTFKPQRNQGAPLLFQSDDGTEDVLNIVQEEVDAGTAALELNKHDTVRITKVELRERQKIAIFLFRRRDEEASTQIFENGKTKRLRKPNKTPDEAPALSAHLFVHLEPKMTPYPVYRAILEEVPGLGRTYVQDLLRKLLRSRQYEYEDAKGMIKNTYTLPTFGGIPSETLGRALQGGSINYVELVRPPNLNGLDMAGLVPHPERMRLSVKLESGGTLKVLRRVRKWADNNRWPDLRVQVKTDEERTRVVQIAREADAADVLFVKSDMVTTTRAMDQCTEVINEELVSHAKKMMSSGDGWG